MGAERREAEEEEEGKEQEFDGFGIRGAEGLSGLGFYVLRRGDRSPAAGNRAGAAAARTGEEQGLGRGGAACRTSRRHRIPAVPLGGMGGGGGEAGGEAVDEFDSGGRRRGRPEGPAQVLGARGRFHRPMKSRYPSQIPNLFLSLSNAAFFLLSVVFEIMS